MEVAIIICDNYLYIQWKSDKIMIYAKKVNQAVQLWSNMLSSHNK